ncbi:UPF0149 family protein [Sphingomonas sp. RP10(2022)]|uniref:UPF0149 family protein n=1 Tax=Sphingomonas liriopis TaxID=2949094 RepID=A0A9X2HSI5_9SPHN|nr:UPF0149 family protein [Sphingomonas liriopis]MCP3735737.1 UPF0149 family protein [Sphingomonas liriopis]
MRQLPSRLRRLDDALAALPLDEPMLLTELDGFLTGIVVGPEPIVPAEWMQSVWGSDDSDAPPFDEPEDVRWFADAVMAQHDAIARDLGRGKPQPVFDIDERNGDVLWEAWIDGFAAAMELRPDAWAAVVDGADVEAADAAVRMMTLIAVAEDDGTLDSMQIDALQDGAPSDIAAAIVQLHAARQRRGGAVPEPVGTERVSKIGRNDPCRCGSGKKFKRCCG